jgi:hypothetical protein
MYRGAFTVVVLNLGLVCDVTAQSNCSCGPQSLQAVTAPIGSVYYTGGGTSLSLAPRPVGASSPSAPAAVPYSLTPGYTTYRPLVPIAPMPASYYVGRGILGQPTLYVPGQPVRNFLRYLSP